MELAVFVTLTFCFLMLMMASSVLPDQKTTIIISGFSIVVLGAILLLNGVSWGGMTMLKNGFTNSVGVMFILFGVSMGISSAVTS